MFCPVALLLLCCRVAPCLGANASPERFSNISTRLFTLPGDIMLGGLFAINELTSNLSQRTEPDNISCESLNHFELGLSIVMKFAVDEINRNQVVLPGIKLGYEIYDTCRQSAVIVRPTVSFLTEKHSEELSVECNYTDYETSISAVIGPYSSEMVSVIGKLLGFFLMPQISYGATSDKFSDNHLYPSFFRTVPSDKWQVEVIGHLLKEFGWNWVAVVGSEEEYGQRGVQQFSKVAEDMSICVAYQGLIPVYADPEPVVQTILNYINATNARVVVVFSLPEPTQIFFREVIRRNMTAVWIASTSWSLHYRLTSLPGMESVGSVIGFTDKTQNLDQLLPYVQELFSRISEERQRTEQRPPQAAALRNPCPQCRFLSPANISVVMNTAVQRSAFGVYAAVFIVAEALHKLLDCNSTACVWEPDTKIYPWELLKVLRNTSTNINGTLLEFDENGNPNIGYNVIQWLWTDAGVDFTPVGVFDEQLSINTALFRWHTKDQTVPQSKCSADCEDGQVRRVKGFHSCCYDCIDCLPGTYQKEKDDIQCTVCPEGQWSLVRSTGCTQPVLDYLSWDAPSAVGMVVAGGLLLLCQGAVGVVFWKHRHTPLVAASGGAQGFAALLSLMGACLSLVLFLGRPTDLGCRLQLPLTCMFQTLALCIIQSVSLQILYLTEFPEKAASHLHIMRGPKSAIFLLGCCAVQAGLSGWFMTEAPWLSDYVANMKIDFVRTYLSCPVSPLVGFALMQGFNCLLALVSFMSTFMAVKPLHQYNLARDITFSSLIYCVIWVTFIPIYIGLSQTRRTVVHVSFNLVSNLGLVVAYFVPKCYFLLRKPELNTTEYFCTFLKGVPPRPAEEEPQPQAEK